MRLVLLIALMSAISCSNKARTNIPNTPGSGATATQANLEQSAGSISTPSGPTTLQPVGTPSLVPAPVTPPKPKKNSAPKSQSPANPVTTPSTTTQPTR